LPLSSFAKLEIPEMWAEYPQKPEKARMHSQRTPSSEDENVLPRYCSKDSSPQTTFHTSGSAFEADPDDPAPAKNYRARAANPFCFPFPSPVHNENTRDTTDQMPLASCNAGEFAPSSLPPQHPKEGTAFSHISVSLDPTARHSICLRRSGFAEPSPSIL